MPLIGMGTWELSGKACTASVEEALLIGYRHIDTAFSYENHREVGKALKRVNREEIFLTTKFTPDIKGSVEEVCDLALKELDTDYLDALLIHWPYRDCSLEKILEALFTLVEKDKLRFPGVSNYTIHHMQDAFDAGLSIPVNQVEFHPYLYQKELLEFANRHGTKLVAYRPFGKGKLLKEESLFGEIGEKYGKTAGQVVLRWITQKGIPVIPKASSEKHLKENFESLDFDLGPEDIKKIDELGKKVRYCIGGKIGRPDEFEY